MNQPISPGLPDNVTTGAGGRTTASATTFAKRDARAARHIWRAGSGARIWLRGIVRVGCDACYGVGPVSGRGGGAARQAGRGRAGRGPGFGPGFGWGLAVAAVVAALAVVTPALPAAAVGVGGNGQFGLTPVPDSKGSVAPYFMLTVAAGESAAGTALISNLGHVTEKLKLSRATGVTAGNGGSTFNRSFQGCSGTGCWVSGLAGEVTLPAGAAEKLPFMVRVPAGTPPGQYLAGLTAEAAARPPSVQVGSNGKATARAVIIEQVTVGVAVTVGVLSRMTTRLRIPGVSGQAIGPTARLNMELANTGQTFAHGTGTASCTAAGRRHSFAVYASTVLPHDQAVIAVNAPGLPEGATMPCAVRLGYGNGLIVRWAGLVSVPAPPPERIVHTGPGAYSVVPDAGIPAWAVALLVVGVLVLAAMAAVLLLRLRRRRRLVT